MSKEIIEMATQVGIRHIELFGAKQFIEVWLPDLEAFAKLVEKRKCEELAKKIEAMPFGTTGESFAVWIREQA